LVWAIPDGTPITVQPSSLPGTLSLLRLLALAAFIVLAAFLSVLADLEWPAVVGVTALAWAIAATVEWFAWQTRLVWPSQRRYRSVPPVMEPSVPPPSPPEPPPIVYAEPPAEESSPQPLYEPEPSPPVEEPHLEAESPAEQQAAATETAAVESAPADEPQHVGAGLVPPANEREPNQNAEPEPSVPPAERPPEGRHAEPSAEEERPELIYEPEPSPPQPVGAGLVPPADEREAKPDAEAEPTVPPDERLPQERRSWLPQLKRRPPASHTEPLRGEVSQELREPPLRAVETPPPSTAEPASTEAAPEETAVVRMSSRRSPEPQQWNVWDLEAIARQDARSHPARRDEWSYLFVHLRQFADAEGTLPREFDALVRESFGDMLEARNLV
jgi:hypothetical protein